MNKLFKIFMLFMMPVIFGLVLSCKDDEGSTTPTPTPNPNPDTEEPTEEPAEEPTEEQEPAEPAITSVDPAQGPVGTVVTITGTDLEGVTAVQFGSVDAEGFDAANNTATSITATVPAGLEPGAHAITVTSEGGTATFDFTVTEPAPVIALFSPDSRLIGGKVTITGANLDLVTSVWLGEVEATDFTPSEDGTKLSFTVPAGAQSSTITLKTDAGDEVESAETLTVIPLPPFTFSPNAGPVGTVVTLSEADFSGVTSVRVGQTEITDVTLHDDGTLSFAIPSEEAAGTITAGSMVTNKQFYIVEEGMVADFDTNAMLRWPQNGTADWGWGISNDNITNTANGIEPTDGYFALIDMDIAPARAWDNAKVINLVDWSGDQIFPEAPQSTYDPEASISEFAITMDVAVAQPASLDGLEFQIGAYNAAGGLLTTNVVLADVVVTTDGTWYKVSVPLEDLAKNGTSFATYGDLLEGGLPADDSGIFVHHLQLVINNTNAEGTEPIPATVGIDNIRIERGVE